MKHDTSRRALAEPITVERAAERLGVSPATVWRWSTAGRIGRRHYLGRTVFDAEAVERIARDREGARPATD